MRSVAAAAHEAQQEQEHVDEVEVEAERPEDDRLAFPVGATQVLIVVLEPLRIVSRQAREDEHAEDADRKVQTLNGGAGEEGPAHVKQRCQDEADHTHEKEAAPTGDILLGRVAPQAEARKGGSGREEGAGCGGRGDQQHQQ